MLHRFATRCSATHRCTPLTLLHRFTVKALPYHTQLYLDESYFIPHYLG